MRWLPKLMWVLLTVVFGDATDPTGRSCRAKRGSAGAAGRAWNAIEKECRDKLEANRTAAAMHCLDGHFRAFREPGKRDGDWHTTLRKLRHDAEMFTWLEDEGKVKAEVKKLWRGVFQSAKPQHVDKPDKVFEVNFQEQNDDRKIWLQTNNKAVHIDPSGLEVPKKTVRVKLLSNAEASLAKTGHAVVDRLLADKALRYVRRFLQTSTFYFYPRPGNHLLALLEDGIASPLMAQFSDGLRLAMPKSLGPLPLTGVAVWKADNSMLASGSPGQPELLQRSQDAAVSVLYWIVPASALNGSVADVLEIRPTADENALPQGEKDSGGVQFIKYASNRAVIWDPQLFDVFWKGPGWRTVGGGFLKRGIHVLMNFGWSKCGADSS